MNITNELLTRFLMKTPLFEDFDEETVAAFLPLLQVVNVDEHRTIFEEGSVGDAWYLVLSGEVSVAKNMPSGPPHVLAHLEECECFGEMALIDGAPRMANVYALADTILVRFSRESFLQMLREGHSGAVRLLWAMTSLICTRQRDLTHLLADLVEVPNEANAREYEMLSQLLRTSVTWN